MNSGPTRSISPARKRSSKRSTSRGSPDVVPMTIPARSGRTPPPRTSSAPPSAADAVHPAGQEAVVEALHLAWLARRGPHDDPGALGPEAIVQNLERRVLQRHPGGRLGA